MFSSGCSLTKLKTNLRLTIQRLDYVQKKKVEISKKNRKEIADLLRDHKVDRARIKVEQIIRDDYSVEAMDIIQTYCEMVNERFGILQDSKTIDPSLEMPIATIMWSKSRLKNEIKELEVVCEQLGARYGKPFVTECCEKAKNVNRTVMAKLNSVIPGANLVEMYLSEIAKSYEVEFTPDMKLIQDNTFSSNDQNLISFDSGNSGGLPSIPSDFAVCPLWPAPSNSENAPYPANDYISDEPQPPPLPSKPVVSGGDFTHATDNAQPPPYDFNVFGDQYPTSEKLHNEGIHTSDFDQQPQQPSQPPPPTTAPYPVNDENEQNNFDDLSKRFEDLKNKK